MNQSITYEVDQVMPQAVSTGLFVSLCTIQSPDNTFGPSGAPSGTYADVSGLVLLRCMDAPPSMARIQATEVKAVEEIMAKGMRHILLDSWYPAIIPGVALGWRAVIDGVLYDLMGAEQDSQRQQTRLDLQLVNV